MRKDDNKDIYYLMMKQIDFFLYSVPEQIYEEVRTALINRGLALAYVFRYQDLPRVMYTSFKNLKIDVMRKYYREKSKYNDCQFDEEYHEAIEPDYKLDKEDNDKLYKIRMEALITAVKRMRPTQRKLIRLFFKEYYLRRDFHKYKEFEIKARRIFKIYGCNKRRGFLLLQQVRTLLKQVIRDRCSDTIILYSSKPRVSSFDELWEKIKGKKEI